MARNRIHNYHDRLRAQNFEQLRNLVVSELLCAHLLDVLPKWVEQDRLSQFSEDMRERIQEGM
jgi:hypothetical protein